MNADPCQTQTPIFSRYSSTSRYKWSATSVAISSVKMKAVVLNTCVKSVIFFSIYCYRLIVLRTGLFVLYFGSVKQLVNNFGVINLFTILGYFREIVFTSNRGNAFRPRLYKSNYSLVIQSLPGFERHLSQCPEVD